MTRIDILPVSTLSQPVPEKIVRFPDDPSARARFRPGGGAENCHGGGPILLGVRLYPLRTDIFVKISSV